MDDPTSRGVLAGAYLAGHRSSISFMISSAQRTASDIADIVAGTRLSASY